MYQILIITTTNTTLQSVIYRSEWAATYFAMRLVEASYVTTIYVIDLDTGEIVYDFTRA